MSISHTKWCYDSIYYLLFYYMLSHFSYKPSLRVLVMSATLLLLHLFPSEMLAQEDVNYLCIEMTSGEDVYFYLDQYPVVTFDDGDVIFSTRQEVLRFADSEISSFRYGFDWDYEDTQIKQVITPKPVIRLMQNNVIAKGLEPNSKVQAYSLDGIMLGEVRSDAQGNATLTLPATAQGMYMIKTSVTTFKICKL